MTSAARDRTARRHGQATTPEIDARPRRALAGGVFASLAAQAGATVAAMLTSVTIARLLGPAGNGVVALVVNILGLGALVFSIGLRAGVTYEVSCGRWTPSAALRAMTASGCVLGILGTGAVIGLFLGTRDSVFSGLNATTAVAAACALPFVLVSYLTSAIALAREHYELYASLQLLPPVAQLVFAVGLAIPFGVTGAAVGVALASAAGAVWTWLAVRRRVARGVQPHGRRFRAALSFGVQNWGAGVLQVLNYRIDLFILNIFAATSAVGIYSIAVTITSLGWLLPNALQTVLFPRTASLDAAVARKDITSAEADTTTIKAIRQAVALSIPTVAVLLALLGAGVPLLYGGRFADATWLGLILVPGVVAIGVGKVLIVVTSGRGYPRYSVFTGLLSAPLTIGLYYVVIPVWGAWGAAAASTVSYIVTTGAAWIFFRRVTRLPTSCLWPTRTEIHDMGEALSAIRRQARSRLPLA